jgi:hypothetical protein
MVLRTVASISHLAARLKMYFYMCSLLILLHVHPRKYTLSDNNCPKEEGGVVDGCCEFFGSIIRGGPHPSLLKMRHRKIAKENGGGGGGGFEEKRGNAQPGSTTQGYIPYWGEAPSRKGHSKTVRTADRIYVGSRISGKNGGMNRVFQE